ISFMGDGATNRGTFHEGIDLAAIWSLPVVLVIENNMYAEATPITDTCKLANVSDRAVSYGISGKTVDGNDVLAVYEIVAEAVAKARKGEGPTLIECKTYRWLGHFEGDAMTYRTKAEFEDWKKRDPIPRFRKKLAEMGVLSEEAATKIDQEIKDEIDRAVKFAEESPLPAPELTLEDVYV
ncbi:MAG: pyruvate dehydrogenase (acetyl-transferring) E1 component subunit alpha, partial [Dehalococcoidales bacterium]|nr:pyruvate dehydrogenase (acetyl-transferring) E1 component subunit alpha [Dehalococcoidales bacterium]